MVDLGRAYEDIQTIFLVDKKLTEEFITEIINLLFSQGCTYNKIFLGRSTNLEIKEKDKKEHIEEKKGKGDLKKAIKAIEKGGKINLDSKFCGKLIELHIYFYKEKNKTRIDLSISERLHLWENPKIWDEFKEFAEQVFKKISEKYECKDITKEKTEHLRAVTSVFYENIE